MNGILKFLDRRPLRLLFYALALASLVSGLYLALLKQEGSQAFPWAAARALLGRQNPYHLSLMAQRWPELPSQHRAMLAVQPPSALVLLWPYALLPWKTAKWAWALSNLGFSLAALWLLHGFFPGLPLRRLVILACLWAAGGPWRACLAQGQAALFCLAFFLAALEGLRRQRPLLAGLALAFTFLDPGLGLVFLLFFFWTRQWKSLGLALALHLSLLALACHWLGRGPHLLLADNWRVFGLRQVEGGLPAWQGGWQNRAWILALPCLAWASAIRPKISPLAHAAMARSTAGRIQRR